LFREDPRRPLERPSEEPREEPRSDAPRSRVLLPLRSDDPRSRTLLPLRSEDRGALRSTRGSGRDGVSYPPRLEDGGDGRSEARGAGRS
jgi:hypothetical protein